ncbi:hypothetical protein VNO77_22246 [Canavalia gladiata]|uniref:protein-serine/threonine phosphatase n=1 Tax=Canavalia gladiata TaxID=3824 RepID=A0AAN9L288_CANGL
MILYDRIILFIDGQHNGVTCQCITAICTKDWREELYDPSANYDMELHLMYIHIAADYSFTLVPARLQRTGLSPVLNSFEDDTGLKEAEPAAGEVPLFICNRATETGEEGERTLIGVSLSLHFSLPTSPTDLSSCFLGKSFIDGKGEAGLNYYMDSLCCFNSVNQVVGGGRSSCSSGKGKSHQCSVKYGFSLVKGKANHPMEDYHVAKIVKFGGHELGLFAIYDGHLGDSVPAYLQKHLFSNILNEEDFWTDPNSSIIKAYETTDQAILSNSSDLGRGGSTAVTAILINNQKLWVANVGDSRAVLSRGGVAIQMTTDHEPNTERGIIENKGGFVSNMPGDVARVNGQLAVSRAFGDKNLKSHLRSDPDIQHYDIGPDTEILILASDGLWKVMANQEAVDIARRIKDPQKAAKQLAAEALKRESKDDISCIVVRFKG